ncbi:unnamed protein product [Phytomonas sp. EM1]|nr:unnamed protein product [Phytomonas sp. EM1]|eukprot:CCW59554.1 unnamed protein product [Phytomonas sp. isolate EM1]
MIPFHDAIYRICRMPPMTVLCVESIVIMMFTIASAHLYGLFPSKINTMMGLSEFFHSNILSVIMYALYCIYSGKLSKVDGLS